MTHAATISLSLLLNSRHESINLSQPYMDTYPDYQPISHSSGAHVDDV